MYEAFYDLKRTPFTRTMPTDQLYITPDLNEFHERLRYVSERQLFAVLTGDCGTGKTTLLRRFKDSLDPNHFKVLYISDSKLTPRNFYRLLLDQLGVVAKYTRGDAKRQLHEQVAVMRAVDGVDTVCVCDESHLLSFEMLEEIRFLLNMQFDSVSPLSLILSGQNELWKKLQLQKCNAIRQRIDVQCMLGHFDRAQTENYIRHQLAFAGAESDIFTDEAINLIHEFSAGTARVIDKVCTNLLIYGSQSKKRLIDDHAVRAILDGEFS